MNSVNIHTGNCLDILPTMEAGSVNCCVTSPPYFGLRDYGNDEQIGLEATPEAFVESMVNVFREVKRVLADDGTLWLNLGDTYSTHASSSKKHSHNFRSATDAAENGIGTMKKNAGGLPEKNLMGIPWRVALALQSDGWILRNDIIWHKPNPTPGGQGSVFDRFTVSHEYIFMLTKQHTYHFDGESIRTSTGARPKDVWQIATHPYSGAHFATFPPDLIKPCILAGCPTGGTVLDPFGGSGTTGMVALELGRSAELIELNPDYVDIIEGRTHVTPGLAL